MAAETSTALVLRTVEFSETSLIVTLLTRDLGRLSAIAKGARRPKGPFEGSLDLLAVCRVVVLRKSSDTLDILTEAKLHRRFRGGERSLDRLYAGYHVAEMLRMLIDDHDPHPEVYDLTIDTLSQIDGTGNLEIALLRFDVVILQLLGHSPGTDRCTDCGRAVNQDKKSHQRIAFSLSAGGIVCDACRPKQPQTISVSERALQALDQLKNDTMGTEDDRSRFLENDDALIQNLPVFYGELRALLNRYIQTVVGRIPKMQSFLRTKI